jgi:hypothetical protein
MECKSTKGFVICNAALLFCTNFHKPKNKPMRKFLLLLPLFVCQFGLSQESDVKAAVETFFSAFHERDTVAMKAVLANELVLHTVTEKASGINLQVETREAFLKAIASTPKSIKYEEKLLSWNIQIDGKLAHVWTPYEFYINGNVVHTGVNSFQLYWKNGSWKIIYCADTRNRT